MAYLTKIMVYVALQAIDFIMLPLGLTQELDHALHASVHAAPLYASIRIMDKARFKYGRDDITQSVMHYAVAERCGHNQPRFGVVYVKAPILARPIGFIYQLWKLYICG